MTQARDLADGKFDTDTLVVDAANNRVGIGTASPAVVADIKSSGATSTALRVLRSDATANLHALTEISGHGRLSVYDGSENEDVRLDSNGISFLSGGLTFDGSTTAANALDDYEEGTWTPAFTSTGASFSYSSQTGSYTKVGRLVHLIFDLRLSGTPSGTTSNSVKISGIPFTAGGMSGFFGGAIGHYFNINLQSSRTELVYQLSNSATVAELKQSGDNQSEINCVASDLTSSTQIRGSMTYFQQ